MRDDDVPAEAGHNLGLTPCPFCGKGSYSTFMPDTAFDSTTGNFFRTGLVELRHWCERVAGEPSPRMMVFVGHTLDQALAAWNRRQAPAQRPSRRVTVRAA